MNEKYCRIALTFLDQQVVNLTTFTKTSYNSRYYITFYKQPEIDTYNKVCCIQDMAKHTNKCFTSYNDIIEFIKTF